MTSRAAFYALEVLSIARAAIDGSAATVTLRVPEELSERFSFLAGQHVTVRAELGGAEVRRSYSLCAPPRELRDQGQLRVAIRAVPGGTFSSYALNMLRPGDLLELSPPDGHFRTAVAPDRARRYAAVAAGSGITPIISLVTDTLAVEQESSFTVIYGNRTVVSAMFLEELADLKNRHGPRLQLVYCFSQEVQSAGPRWRRLDGAALDEVFASLLAPPLVDEWFVCGPHAMAHGAREALERAGVPARLVHTELFRAEAPAVMEAKGPAAGARQPTDEELELTVRLDGRTSTVRVASGSTLLESALAIRPELPFSCRTGVCGTCRARLVSGVATMRSDFALTADEKAARYLLTCQAVPGSRAVSVDYDVA